MDFLLHYILPFIGILLGLIVIHEAGHYITAKMFGVKVLEAGIGLPPRIWGFRWRGTDYTLNAIPMGAFVRMLGEEDPEAQEDPDSPRESGKMNPQSLAAQPKWKRTVIISAGWFINFVAAVVLFAIAEMIPHPVPVGGAAIASVVPNSPAANAGLQEGDQILEVNGRTTENLSEASYAIRLAQGGDIDFVVKRIDPREGVGATIEKIDNVYARWNPPTYKDACGVDQKQGPTGISLSAVVYDVVPYAGDDLAAFKRNQTDAARDYNALVAADAPAWCHGGQAFGFRGLSVAQCSNLGEEQQADARSLKADVFPKAQDPCYVFEPGPEIVTKTEQRSYNPINAFSTGFRQSFESLILTRNQIWVLARGFNGSSPVTGPVGIAQVTGQVIEEAGWLPLLTLAASISMSLALFNALPLPMVDGGRLFFIFIEFIRGGKRIAPEKEAMVHFAGFVTLILFALVVTYFDIVRVIGGDSILK